MYQALYRKWRPRTFDDVVSQPHITTTLKNQIISGKTAHAYLFTGSRGTGKTTCARIFARDAYPSPSPIRFLGIKLVEKATAVTLFTEKKTPVRSRSPIKTGTVDAIRCKNRQIAYPTEEICRIRLQRRSSGAI